MAIIKTRFFVIFTLILLGCGTNQKNSMSLDELLTKERNQYLETFKLGLSQYQGSNSAIEVTLQITADQNRLHPEIFQLNRYDLINVNAAGKFDIKEFNLDKDSVLKFDQHIFEINGMTVKVKPFVWNGCEFTLDKKPNLTFERWATKWMDIDDKNPAGTGGLQNVIHSVTFPSEESSKWTFSVDFGSAPIDAFKELLNTLSAQGIKTAEIHSKTFTN